MADLQIELATQQHIDGIWRILESSFGGPQSQYVAVGQPGYKQYLHDLLSKKKTGTKMLIVGEIDGQIAGFADVTIDHKGSNFLTRIAVKPDYRGYGVARRMMHKIQQAYGVENRWELDVFHANTGARRLYESLGFQIISTALWLGRLLPAQPTAAGDDLLAQLDPSYVRYGFTNTHIQGYEVSVAGTAVRCRTTDIFLNDELLAEVQRQFPKIDRAFIVLNDSDDRLASLTNVFEIDQSHRMVGEF